LGSALTEKLSETSFKVVGLNRSELDITDNFAVREMIDKIRPKFLINCAAWTDVAKAEDRKIEAYLINCTSLEEIIKSCIDFSVKLVHISTDHVFSGLDNTMYKIDSVKGPVNFYGYSKSKGEDLILDAKNLEYWILRTSWLYGNSNRDFVAKILNQYKLSKFPISVVSDQFGHPTYVKDLVERLILMINSDIVSGVYHASNSGITSWYEFARELAIGMNLDLDSIIPVKTKDFSSNVERPISVCLDFSAWEMVNLQPLREWKFALREFINERNKNVENYSFEN
jgi:dTDP-4-dehydrorhamnose reductase